MAENDDIDVDGVEELHVETFAKEHPEKEKPEARVYVIRVDREVMRVHESSLTGREILALVGKTPESHDLFQKFRDGRTEKVGPDERVDFKAPGVERFVTIPKDTTEGRGEVAELRRGFTLPEGDREFLDGLGLPWETILAGRGCWLVIHNYPQPEGYTTKSASLALQIPESYPGTQIDMVYFEPGLALADGRNIGQLTNHALDGKSWQRWSRHRTKSNPWRPDVDNVETHLLLVNEWLERELRR